jgi:hypothetical protein
MRLLERGQGPALDLQPFGMPFGPGLFRGGEAATMAQEEFRESMPRTQEVGADVLATPQQIARGFFLFGRDVNRREGAGAIEHGELPGIATVSFDAIAGTTWNERRSDDVTRNAVGRQRTLQLEATRAGFVATLHRMSARDPFNEASDRRQIGAKRVKGGRSLPVN